jgi:hypothetical protein
MRTTSNRGRNGISDDPRRNDVYSASEIRMLRYATPPWDEEQTGRQKARIEEKLAARNDWHYAIAVAGDEVGLQKAEAAISSLVDERRVLSKQIAACRATTMSACGCTR